MTVAARSSRSRSLDRRQLMGLLAAVPLAGLGGCGRDAFGAGVLTFWTVQLSPQFDD